MYESARYEWYKIHWVTLSSLLLYVQLEIVEVSGHGLIQGNVPKFNQTAWEKQK